VSALVVGAVLGGLYLILKGDGGPPPPVASTSGGLYNALPFGRVSVGEPTRSQLLRWLPTQWMKLISKDQKGSAGTRIAIVPPPPGGVESFTLKPVGTRLRDAYDMGADLWVSRSLTEPVAFSGPREVWALELMQQPSDPSFVRLLGAKEGWPL
jgi:hypothetical protein